MSIGSIVSLTDNVRQTVLENGLTVLTSEVHTAPAVSVQVWYQFGSLDEAPGVNGIAHLLEHMMFKGTTHRPIQFGSLFQALGSQSNAFTSYDQTAYVNTAERDKLEALLVLEADRMQNARLAALDLEMEKRVVSSELLYSENHPRYRLDRAVMRAAFPEHPYGLPVGGTRGDVEQLTLEQVRSYYRHYYRPAHAVLVIVGDFPTEPTLKTVRQTFGQLPGAPREREIVRTIVSTTPAQSTPIVLREPGTVPLMRVVYPLPESNHPDVPALQVMDYILASGRSSRLYQALVESGLASSCGGSASNLTAGGWYALGATAAPGQELAKIEQVLQQVIEDVSTQGVRSEQLSRAKTQIQANAILGNRDLTSQGMQLGDTQTATGDYRHTDRYLGALAQVREQDVQRVAREYLNQRARTVGFFEPTQLEGESRPAEAPLSQIPENFSPPTPVAPRAEYLPPRTSERTQSEQRLPQEFALPNGLQVLLLPEHSTPTVALSGYIGAGEEFDPCAKAGLARLTAQNLISGTQTSPQRTLAKTLENRGAKLWFFSDREGVYCGGSSLAADLSVLLQTLADVWQKATFPTEQLELSRQRRLTALKVAWDNPEYVARRTLTEAIYPENHPFGRFPTAATLKAISREDVVRFYRDYYRPDTTVLALVGDFEPEKVLAQIENLFVGWLASGQPPVLQLPPVPLPPKLVRYFQALPGKASSITLMGHPSIHRRDPRFYTALVLNQILGGSPLSSRLGTELRDRQGLTYGIYSRFSPSIRTGSFSIQMQTAPEDAPRAISITLTVLSLLQEQGVSDAEVETAKGSIISTQVVANTNPELVGDEILMNQVYGLRREELRQFKRKIQAVTPKGVNQAAKQLLHPAQMVVVTAGPPLAASP